ncbi:HAD-IB family phosphatase [Planctomyces sp. SH-PL62]|uniref:HAD-IB family phosphatase n=1 Tax=Planctomyces sp. SH-PL62 TaxID=1636152 RepID=UPI00078C8AB4|nr:HAD-IB family phosphatase [Planctomyces sp. SH-PL62]AMV38860.1 2-hydroxy-3-keto-5-methylthiopentenyl-1-phosphate phosphatase [Planctomyces sp. SH-PL62]
MSHDPSPATPPRSLLVTDFDGTLTREDFYQLAIKQLLPADLPDYWGEYRAGRLTHFQALQAYFSHIRDDERAILNVVDQMHLEPRLAECLRELDRAGWDVVVTSAGCAWYIDILLGKAGVDIPVYSNPGRFEPGRGLMMEPPPPGPFFCNELGVDKAGVVRHGLGEGRRVAFAGDGFPDQEAAKLVPESLRFARGDLARTLTEQGLGFVPYERWSEVAERLCGATPAVAKGG